MAVITQTFSQLLLTYGPGAMLDLPENAVVVSGLQDWKHEPNWKFIEEQRLVTLLKEQLGDKLSSSFQGLRQPPIYDEDKQGSHAPGIDVRIFPEWFLVDEKSSGTPLADDDGKDQQNGSPQSSQQKRRMLQFTELNIAASGKLTYNGGGKKVDANPVRFVAACPKGHLQDINWRVIVHRGANMSCRQPLYWIESGVSSDPSDISIRCNCGASVTLGDLYIPKFLGGCECKSPWLTPRHMAGEACSEDLRLLPRSATNTYFPKTVTIISVISNDDKLSQLIADHRSLIDSIKGLPNFLEVLRSLPQTKDVFNDFSDAQIIAALEDKSAGESGGSRNPRIAEFDLLASGAEFIGRDSADSILYAQTLNKADLNLSAPWQDFLRNVVKVHRLREVTCLYGFTRLEPPPTSAESELDEIQLAVDGASLARQVEWLPAIEQFGEGIFLHIEPDYIKKWLQSPAIQDKAAQLRDRETKDAERFGRKPLHFGASYWALHSLSHAFMAELALECGYPLSSLKERIYSSGVAQADRFGILIYTSTAGGQGTLGGLSNMAHQVGVLLERAVKHLEICSNDPICAEHSNGNEDYPLQGAACHSCLLVPETSCEARNTRLDRSLLTTTILNSSNPLFP